MPSTGNGRNPTLFRPSLDLDRCALGAAARASRAMPQLAARDERAPADHERHDGASALCWHRSHHSHTHGLASAADLAAIDAAAALPIGQIPKAEVMGFAAHAGRSDRDRRGGSQPLDLVGCSTRPPNAPP
jgi:hypothetical protein